MSTATMFAATRPEPLIAPLEATACRRALIDKAGDITTLAPQPLVAPRITGELLDDHRRRASRLRAEMFRRAFARLGRWLRAAVQAN